MITRNAPDTWQSLQTEVGRILEECGFGVEVEKRIQSARGVVELDVYAEETVAQRRDWDSFLPVPRFIVSGAP